MKKAIMLNILREEDLFHFFIPDTNKWYDIFIKFPINYVITVGMFYAFKYEGINVGENNYQI